MIKIVVSVENGQTKCNTEAEHATAAEVMGFFVGVGKSLDGLLRSMPGWAAKDAIDALLEGLEYANKNNVKGGQGYAEKQQEQ